MPRAIYRPFGSEEIATLEVPDTHEFPHMLVIPRKNEHDNGTTQQYFYKEEDSAWSSE